jgi:hypothetical protein
VAPGITRRPARLSEPDNYPISVSAWLTEVMSPGSRSQRNLSHPPASRRLHLDNHRLPRPIALPSRNALSVQSPLGPSGGAGFDVPLTRFPRRKALSDQSPAGVPASLSRRWRRAFRARAVARSWDTFILQHRRIAGGGSTNETVSWSAAVFWPGAGAVM